MTDKFNSHTAGLSSPPANLIAVTPSDDTDLPMASRCINVSGGGAVRVTTIHGDTATLFVAAGVVFPIRAQRIHATDTTATGIVVMY
ncbi:spike base protein, RCAP_Rcc01079 family [Roseobacter sinensis]|uniref:Uncharacterized protein n=1 Tax=Roseobacter sinensis TaxID=2931391 RepID=A0ABT3BJR8_9RHOB|nr:hypothetical protein [Roseobacter sp. WL0113]MCV3273817.1 hypothetical protein [Roseobacter sp. WL0113]